MPYCSNSSWPSRLYWSHAICHAASSCWRRWGRPRCRSSVCPSIGFGDLRLPAALSAPVAALNMPRPPWWVPTDFMPAASSQPRICAVVGWRRPACRRSARLEELEAAVAALAQELEDLLVAARERDERTEVGRVLGEVRAAEVAHDALVQARCGITDREVLRGQRLLEDDRRIGTARPRSAPGAHGEARLLPRLPRRRPGTAVDPCGVHPCSRQVAPLHKCSSRTRRAR